MTFISLAEGKGQMLFQIQQDLCYFLSQCGPHIAGYLFPEEPAPQLSYVPLSMSVLCPPWAKQLTENDLAFVAKFL